jgi:hypothetical protein
MVSINGIFMIRILLAGLLITNPKIKKGSRTPYRDKKRTDMSNLENVFLSYNGFDNVSMRSTLSEINVILSNDTK